MELSTRYQQVLEEIDRTARQSGRSRDEITLVVVTKGHPPVEIQDLYRLGARQIGENRVAEALEKQTIMSDHPDLNWHMIGHIQSRKANDVAGNFTLIHSLDSTKLARRLDRFAQESGIVQEVLLECNTSGEESKYGFSALDGALTPKVEAALEEILDCTALRVRGLMTMAPYSTDPEDARPSFAALRRLREVVAFKFPRADWSQLSMGMSGDYKVAIQEGATLLRIGTAIMGQILI
jgi:pyridoxal phosphate enzyme (YggS family)